MSTFDLRTTPDYIVKNALLRKQRQKRTKAARKITRQHGQTRRPATR